MLTPGEKMTSGPWDVLSEGSAESIRGALKPCNGLNCNRERKRAYQGFAASDIFHDGPSDNITNPNPMGMPEGIPDIKTTGIIAAVLGLRFIAFMFLKK